MQRLQIPQSPVHDPQVVEARAAAEARAAFDIARGTFDRVSFDLIYARMGQTLADWETELTMGVETSNGRVIQDTAPGAHVVKAFSTLNWRQMVEPGGDISILLAGDNEEAKAKVSAMVEAMDLQPIDLGGVDNSQHIEAMTLLWLNNRIAGRQHFEFYLRPVN